MNRNPQDANKGLNVPRYGEAVGAAVLLILIGILVFVWVSRGKVLRTVDHPKASDAASPQ